MDKRKIKNLKNRRKREIKRKILLARRIVKLKNKGRDGIYIAIKDKKTGIERLYKWQPEYGMRYYETLFKEGPMKLKKHGIAGKGITNKEKYLEKIRKRGSIEEWVGRGYTDTDVDISRLDRYTIKKAYKQMITPLIDKKWRGDKLVVETLSNEENIKKFKYRIEMIISVTGNKGEQITLRGIGKTIEEVGDLIRTNLGHKDLWKKDLDGFKNIGFSVEGDNCDVNKYDKAILTEIKTKRMKLIFRKAK